MMRIALAPMMRIALALERYREERDEARAEATKFRDLAFAREEMVGRFRRERDEALDLRALDEAVIDAARHLCVLFPPPTGSDSPVGMLRDALVARDAEVRARTGEE